MLQNILPAPVHQTNDPILDPYTEEITSNTKLACIIKSDVPPYGYRKNFVPRSQHEFGDGGSFPEIHVAQYPLEMGLQTNKNALQLQLDGKGRPKFDAILKQRTPSDKIIYSKFVDLLPKEIVEDDSDLPQRPLSKEAESVAECTKSALDRIVNSKVSAALPVQHASRQAPAEFIRYIPSQQNPANASGAKQRIVRMVHAQKDPVSPPRFRINQKIPRGPPSPPVPVLHSPTRKGYTIPLDKRLAADGRGLQSVHINEGFAKLAEALYIADKEAREAIEMRAQLERKLAQKEKDRKEEGLRKLAEHARAVRAGVNVRLEDNEDVAEREEIRRERQRARQRERALQRVAPDKRGKLAKEKERDITEKIALGLPNVGKAGGETQFDTRLFNTSKGLDSGFGADDVYGVYDKPWREENELANTIYRPSKNIDAEVYGDDLEKIANARRFEKQKDLRSNGPVKFEKAPEDKKSSKDAGISKPVGEDDDPFGLGQFFKQVKRTTRQTKEESTDSTKKRRKD